MHTMPSEAAVRQAVTCAESVLPGRPAPDGQPDPRWQAIIQVGKFIESHPEPIWEFARRWGKHAQADLRAAVATCLLEHLLEHHFETLFPRVRREALASIRFADTLTSCWPFGLAALPRNAARMQRLKRDLRHIRRRTKRRRSF
jgi:hypothetical protein